MKDDSFTIKGIIRIELFDQDGRLKDSRTVENIVTTLGKGQVIDRLQGPTPAVCDYIAIGTGVTAAVIGDTQLQTEVARSNQTGTSLSQPDAFTDRATVTFAAGTGTGNITEAGRLNAASSGLLMGRQVFTAVNKTSTDSLQITYDFLIS